MPDQRKIPADVVSFDTWVQAAADNPRESLIRRVIRIIVHAVSSNDDLRDLMVIKGGVLLAAGYETERHTRDVDFSTAQMAANVDLDHLCGLLNDAIETSAIRLDEELDCRVQSKRLQPPSPDASFPTLRIRIGYAEKGTKSHVRLLRGGSPHTVIVDLSFNESLGEPVRLQIDHGAELKAYSLINQVAEKYRALIQQQARHRERVRRQDAYDIFQILRQGYLQTVDERRALVQSIRKTCESRAIAVTRESILEPEIRERSRIEYARLGDEIDGNLPDFDEVFDCLADYYCALPWDDESGQ